MRDELSTCIRVATDALRKVGHLNGVNQLNNAAVLLGDKRRDSRRRNRREICIYWQSEKREETCVAGLFVWLASTVRIKPGSR